MTCKGRPPPLCDRSSPSAARPRWSALAAAAPCCWGALPFDDSTAVPPALRSACTAPNPPQMLTPNRSCRLSVLRYHRNAGCTTAHSPETVLMGGGRASCSSSSATVERQPDHVGLAGAVCACLGSRRKTAPELGAQRRTGLRCQARVLRFRAWGLSEGPPSWRPALLWSAARPWGASVASRQ